MGVVEPVVGDADRALVEAVRARARDAFERLVAQHQGLCWHVINRMVRHPEDTRELCQETFLRVYRHLDQYRFESPLKSWIGRIAYTVALRHLERKRIPVADLGDDTALDVGSESGDAFDLEAASASDELVAALRAAVEALPPLQRTLLTLYHFDELPLAEIAAITGLSEGTIKSHLFRSRAKLRARLVAEHGALR
jgi:RNA polymerase sigma-70 factor (ECF subfamily)